MAAVHFGTADGCRTLKVLPNGCRTLRYCRWLPYTSVLPIAAVHFGTADGCCRRHVLYGNLSFSYTYYTTDGAYNLDRRSVPYRTCSGVRIVSELCLMSATMLHKFQSIG